MEAGMPKIRVPANLEFGENPLPGLQKAIFWLYPYLHGGTELARVYSLCLVSTLSPTIGAPFL